MTPEAIQSLITNAGGLLAMILLMNYRLGKIEKGLEEIKKEVVTKEFLEGKDKLYDYRLLDLAKDLNNLGAKVRASEQYFVNLIKKGECDG